MRVERLENGSKAVLIINHFLLEIETLSHPIINELRHQLESEFYKECELMKKSYEEKVNNLNEGYQVF